MENNKFLPLVTARSPSYLRAQEELNGELVLQSINVAAINRLIEAEWDAIGTLQKILGAQTERPVAEMVHLHEERIGILSDLVKRLGGAAPSADEARELLYLDRKPYVDTKAEIDAWLSSLYTALASEYDTAAEQLGDADSLSGLVLAMKPGA
tara:strand:+ start:1722 stop:2180 length:459 start_codon:yes stop_codon:yes gene_type:complete